MKLNYPGNLRYLSVLIMLFLLLGCDSTPPRLLKGKPVPAIQLERLDGSSVQYPSATYQGQVVVIDFWADWCALCRDELIKHEQLYRQFHAQGLEVFAINIEQSRETAEAFIADLGLTYEVLLDKQGSVARSFGVMGLPAAYVIDRQGNLFSRVIGGSDVAQMHQLVKELL
ncbi:TlpA family protein disulfide reductase [Sedimenticola selenatireducens]|uniref:TlpA family protein disulfide reductase n=1 Tax=Sedimenticola selenatireducens TaxID=191960 RepID=A0A558DLT2_9GAMM|nr:TlpA disulfide reductase family protein [Sedimenticola selenatireducens]TVO69541.1 TlpA family protein disulfide reductase [Sedimenticola selenatireducens]TVT61934.1 MAG: TlpA family protein disulfide reductase [Sedimenticola selenatireducens]